MHNTQPAIEASLLEGDPERLSHGLHQAVHDVLKRLAQGVTVPVDRRRDHVVFNRNRHDSVRQVFDPLTNEQLHLGLQQGVGCREWYAAV